MLLALLALTVDAGLRARDARRSLLAARGEFQSVQGTLGPLVRFDASGWPSGAEFARARQQTAAARDSVRAARTRLGYLRGVLRRSGWVPVVGPGLARVPAVLDVAERAAADADALLADVEPVFNGHGTIVDVAREVFVTRGDRLDRDLAQLASLQSQIDSLRAVSWRGPLAPAGPMLDGLSTDLARVPEGRRLAGELRAALDPLLGFNGTATYVVLGQNDTEVRPTGGYVGTMGVVTIANGEIKSSDYRTSNDFDPHPLPDRPPPQPMQQYLGSSIWLLREANWWPNFPSTGLQVAQFMESDQGIRPDGVVAVDTEMVALLLRVFGPISAPGFAEPLTEQNWFAQVEDALYAAEKISGQQAKETYLSPVLKELLDRAEHATRAEIPQLVKVLQLGAQGRHLQVFSRDDAVESLLRTLGVSGEMVRPADSDFVAVIDSNFSYDKIQPAIHRDETYLALENGDVDLLLTWRNDVSTYEGARYARFGKGGGIYDYQHGVLQRIQAVFGNFTRVYLPAGSRLIQVSGFDGPPRYETENGFAVVSGFVVVRDGTQRTVRITYRTPLGAAARQVLFWKQGGFPVGSIQVLKNQDGRQLDLFDGTLDRDITVPLP